MRGNLYLLSLVCCVEEITEALGQICKLYSTNECRNYFKAAGYKAD